MHSGRGSTHEPGATPVGALLRQLLLVARVAGPVGEGRGAAHGGGPGRAREPVSLSRRSRRVSGWSATATRRRPSPTRATAAGSTRSACPSLVTWAADGLAADLSVLVDVSVEVAGARLASAGGPRGGPDGAARPPVRLPGAPGFPLPRPRGIPSTGSSSTARGRRGLTARIVASVRERLGRRAGGAPVSEERPAPELFAGVVGQEEAVAALRAAAVNPVHAYLFRGAAGNGGLAAAHGFAAALLCPDGGCGDVRHLPGRAGRDGPRPARHPPQRRVGLHRGDPPGRLAGAAPTPACGSPGDRRARRAPGRRCEPPRCSRPSRSRRGRRSSSCSPTR